MIEPEQLAEEIAKLNRIEAEHRKAYNDPNLRLEDIAAINDTARHFRVSGFHAYLRAKSLGMLSYQQSALPENPPSTEFDVPSEPTSSALGNSDRTT